MKRFFKTENAIFILVCGFIITLFWIFLFSLALLSCSPDYHKKQYFKKGGTLEIKTEFVKVPADTVWVNGAPVIIYKDSAVYNVEENYIPKWKVRLENNRFTDSLKGIEKRMKLNNQSYSAQLKVQSKAYSTELEAVKKMHQTEVKALTKMYGDRLNAVVKQVKKQEKTDPSLWWMWMIFGSLLTIILILGLKRIPIFGKFLSFFT